MSKRLIALMMSIIILLGTSGIASFSASAEESPYYWYYQNSNQSSQRQYGRMARTNIISDNIQRTAISLQQNEGVSSSLKNGEFQHDAQIISHPASGCAYILMIANKVDTGDAPYNLNTVLRLQRVRRNPDKTLTKLEYWDIAKRGTSIPNEDKSIISGCGLSNAYLVGDTIHIIWSSQCNDYKWYELHTTLNCKTLALGEIEICKLDNKPMDCQSVSSLIGVTNNIGLSINASIAKLNNEYYACVCSENKFKNGIVLKTKDFVNWEYAFEPCFDGITSDAIYEGALGVRNGENALYLALRQRDNDPLSDITPMILAKFKPDGTLIDNVVLPSISSRPSFINIGDKLILLMPNSNRLNTTGIWVGHYTGNIRDSYPLFDLGNPYGNYAQAATNAGNAEAVLCFTYGTQGVFAASSNLYPVDDANAGSMIFHEHTYEEEIIEPTKDNLGYTIHKCSICDHQYIDSYIPAIIPKPDVIEKPADAFITKTTPATCTEDGRIEYSCSNCDQCYYSTIKALGHSYTNVLEQKSGVNQNGSIATKCTRCNSVKSRQTINAIGSVVISKTQYLYNSKINKPAVTVKDSKGNIISPSSYTVYYPSNCKNVGKHIVRVVFGGNYAATVERVFYILPNESSISKLTPSKKSINVSWKKQKEQISGYQVQIATDKNFKTNRKTYTIKGASTVSKKITKLKGMKRYYVRVRTYKTATDKTYYSKWSNTKSVITKM